MTLKQEVKELRQLVQELRQEIARLQAENAQLRAENAQLRAENAELRALLEQKEKKGSPPSFVKPNREKKEKQPRKQREARHNQARKRETPTRIEQHRLEACPDCGQKLEKEQLHYQRQVIEIPEPQPVEVIEHQITKGWCARCGKWHCPTPDWEGVVIGQGRMGVRLAGLIGYLRAVLRVPLRGIQQYLETVHRLEISIGEISQLCRRVTEELADVGEQLKEEVRASAVVHMDETGWREDGQNGYIWCLVTDDPQPVRYYEYHKSRAQPVVVGMLGPSFRGHIVSDFYNAYNIYAGAHQRCWVHLLRDLHNLREKHAQETEIVDWTLAVAEQYRRAQEVLTLSLTQQDRQGFYQLFVAATQNLALPYAQADHPCRALGKRLLRHEDELFQFVLHPYVPADNNLAERALRSLVVQRKISGGSRSPEGSKTRMALASLFETWKARHLNPLVECWRALGLAIEPALPSP